MLPFLTTSGWNPRGFSFLHLVIEWKYFPSAWPTQSAAVGRMVPSSVRVQSPGDAFLSCFYCAEAATAPVLSAPCDKDYVVFDKFYLL